MARPSKPVPDMLDAGLKGYIINQARKNLWRVQPLYEFDDLVQEGYMCFAICKKRYGHIESSSHFMSLFKTTFQNQMHDLATARTRQQIVYEEEEASKNSMSIDFNCGQLLLRLNQLPPYLRKFIELATTEIQQPRLKNTDKERETNNEYFCRLLGIDPTEYDLEMELKLHLI